MQKVVEGTLEAWQTDDGTLILRDPEADETQAGECREARTRHRYRVSGGLHHRCRCAARAGVTVTVYSDANVPEEIQGAMTSFVREAAYQLAGQRTARSRWPMTSRSCSVTDRAGDQVSHAGARLRPDAHLHGAADGDVLDGVAGLDRGAAAHRHRRSRHSGPDRRTSCLPRRCSARLMSLGQGLIILLLVGGLTAQNWSLVLVALLMGSMMFTGVALFVGSAGKDFMGQLFYSMLFMIPLLIPAFSVMFPGTAASWVRAIPTYPIIDTLVGAFNYGATWSDACRFARVRGRVAGGPVRCRPVRAEAEGGVAMSLKLMWKVLRKDLALGPRSPILPVGDRAAVRPDADTAGRVRFAVQSRAAAGHRRRWRLGDHRAGRTDGWHHPHACSTTPRSCRSQVEANDLDAGLILPAGLRRCRQGRRASPTCSSSSAARVYASNRIILTRHRDRPRARARGKRRAGRRSKVVSFGDDGLPISIRLVPVIVFYALVMAGIFVPGSSLVEEKEHGTLMALLVTPVRIADVLAAKWALGTLFATIMATATLVLNQALGSNWLQVLVVVVVAASALLDDRPADGDVRQGLDDHVRHGEGAGHLPVRAHAVLHLPRVAAVDREALPAVLDSSNRSGRCRSWAATSAKCGSN